MLYLFLILISCVCRDDKDKLVEFTIPDSPVIDITCYTLEGEFIYKGTAKRETIIYSDGKLTWTDHDKAKHEVEGYDCKLQIGGK